MKRVGIIGCGAIGTLIAKAVENGTVECEELILYDYNTVSAEKLRRSLDFPVRVVKNVSELIKLKPAVIVEAASQQAVREYTDEILANNIELVIMSVGALLDFDLKSEKIHITAGAIGGLDAISAAALAGIDEVILTTRKNPETLDMDNQQEELVYEGNVQEAVKLYPKEMNVAATLALTVQQMKVKVKVVSDPKADRNVHEIQVRWRYGDMFLKFENDPHPENPGTSALAAWSAIRLLKELLQE